MTILSKVGNRSDKALIPKLMGNPFSHDIFDRNTFTETPARTVYAEELDELVSILDTLAEPKQSAGFGSGIILFLAPRAGYGKSHFLAKFSGHARQYASVVTLNFPPELPLGWEGLLYQTAQQVDCSKNGISRLSEMTRFMFAMMTAELIQKQQVPCSKPNEAIRSLHERFIAIFDPEENEEVANWFTTYFKSLSPAMAETLASETGIARESTAFWLETLFQLHQKNGLSLYEALEKAPSHRFETTESRCRRLLSELIRLFSLYQPTVFIVDHLDHVYQKAHEGRQIAYFLSELQTCASRVMSILSLNQDVWEDSFFENLPSALEDRLTTQVVPLGGITEREAYEMIEDRFRETGIDEDSQRRFLSDLDLSSFFSTRDHASISPRQLLRYLSSLWQEDAQLGQTSSNSKSEAFVSTEIPALDKETLESMPPEEEEEETEDEEFEAPEFPQNFQNVKTLLARIKERSDEVNLSLPSRNRPHSNGSHPTPAAKINPLLPFRTVIETAGKRFPIVKQSYLSVPGSNQEAMVWEFQDQEVIFGFEAYENDPFWREVIGVAKSRYNRGLHTVKLVIFSIDGEPRNLNGWLYPDGAQKSSRTFLDVIDIEKEDLEVIKDTADLMNDPEADPDKIAYNISNPLDALWRRLTRPLQNAVR